jgi:signal peptidase
VTGITLPPSRTGSSGQVDVPSAAGWLEQRLDLSVLVPTMLIACLILVIWPVQLGGRFALTIVAGNSMEPTYMLGDVVVTWQEPAEVGDVVVLRVPEGEFGAGNLVIHRVIGVDSAGWVTQGDNSSGPDAWTTSDNDIVGVAKFELPYSGRLLAITRSWLFIAALGVLAIAMFIWPATTTPLTHRRTGSRRLAWSRASPSRGRDRQAR